MKNFFDEVLAGRTDNVKKALEMGVDIDKKDSYGETALIMAATEGNTETVRLLVDNGANINEKDNYGYTALMRAVGYGYKEIVEILIDNGAYINEKNNDGNTALRFAVSPGYKKDVKIIKLLLDNGAKNIPNNKGITPFKVVIKSKDKEIIDLFLTAPQIPSEELFENKNVDIFKAVKNNNIADVKKALAMGVDVNEEDNEGDTALMWAAVKGHTEIVQLLIDNGANINQQNDEGYTALMFATLYKHAEIIQFLIDKGAKIDDKNNHGETALILAARNGRTEIIKLLINNGANVNEKDNDDYTPLINAATYGHKEIVKLLLDNGAKNIPNNEGETPFKLAVKKGNKEIIDLFLTAKQIPSEELFENKNVDIFDAVKNNNIEGVKKALEMGVDVNIKNDEGDTALILAAIKGWTEIVQLLIDNGAKLDEKDFIDRTVLMAAARNGQTEIVRLLIDNGANVNEKNKWGDTALILAAENGKTEIAQLLIDNGANINEKDNYGYTALMRAVGYGYKEIVEILIDNGAYINEKNNDGNTALRFAVSPGYKKDVKIIKLLLDNGAKNIPNNKGDTPFKLAVKKGNKEIIDLFLTAPQIPSEELFESIGLALRKDEIPERYKHLKILGRGRTSIVLDKDENTVIVLTRDLIKKDYVRDVLMGEYLEDFLVKGKTKIRGLGDYPIYALEMKKLFKLSPKNKKIVNELLLEYNKELFSIKDKRFVISDLYHRYYELNEKGKETAKVLFPVFDWLSNYDATPDLHPGQFMQDSDGQIVVVDPAMDKELFDCLKNHRCSNLAENNTNSDYVEYHDNLSNLMWDKDNTLNKEVHLKLLKIAKQFILYLDTPLKIEDIILVGSMANFNYTKFSDIDLHIQIDTYKNFKNCDELARNLFDTKKSLWNKTRNIKIKNHDVELYIEDINQKPFSGGVYSLLKNKWIQKPKYNKPFIDDNEVRPKIDSFIKKIDTIISNNESINSAEKLLDVLYQFRKAGLSKNGEYSVENITFKHLRNLGYLDKLKNYIINKFVEELSLK